MISSAAIAKKAPISLICTVKGALASSRGSKSFMSIIGAMKPSLVLTT